MAEKKDGAAKVAAYLGGLDAAKRTALEHVRAVAMAAAPGAEEALVYGVPGLKLNGKGLVCYAGFKAHCGFYPMNPDLMDALQAELKGFRTAKGTIHFTPEAPLPDTLIERIVKARVAEIMEKSRGTA